MPVFSLAWRTRKGSGPQHDAVVQGHTSPQPEARKWIILARHSGPFHLHSGLTSQAVASPRALLCALAPEACLCVSLDPVNMTLTCSVTARADGGPPLHYFRLADGRVRPLLPDPESLTFSAGDTYVALCLGARRVTDSPSVARFLHERDDFNADKLAASLLDHLLELAGSEALAEDITALVVEAR